MIHQFSDDSMLQSTSSGPIGIHPGSSVEISGPPGSGKTAISIALALAAVNQQPSAEVLLIGKLFHILANYRHGGSNHL